MRSLDCCDFIIFSGFPSYHFIRSSIQILAHMSERKKKIRFNFQSVAQNNLTVYLKYGIKVLLRSYCHQFRQVITMEKDIFDCITKNSNDELKTRLTGFKGNINFVDENGKNVVKCWENIFVNQNNVIKVEILYSNELRSFQAWQHCSMLHLKATEKLCKCCWTWWVIKLENHSGMFFVYIVQLLNFCRREPMWMHQSTNSSTRLSTLQHCQAIRMFAFNSCSLA